MICLALFIDMYVFMFVCFFIFLFFIFYFLYIFLLYYMFFICFLYFYFFACNSAFEQGYLEPWRYINALLLLLLLLLLSAKQRLEIHYPSIFTPLFSQFNLLNMLFNVSVNSLCEMVSPCINPLLILIFSLSLCRYTVTELSESESESEMFLFDPYQKYIQSNNETILDQGTLLRPAWSLT